MPILKQIFKKNALAIYKREGVTYFQQRVQKLKVILLIKNQTFLSRTLLFQLKFTK